MGDALLPVERTMIEDKAGWGLVPGLQPLLHTHSHTHRTLLPPRRAVGNSYYCWAGLGRAGLGGCAELKLACRSSSESLRRPPSLGSQAKAASEASGFGT